MLPNRTDLRSSSLGETKNQETLPPTACGTELPALRISIAYFLPNLDASVSLCNTESRTYQCLAHLLGVPQNHSEVSMTGSAAFG